MVRRGSKLAQRRLDAHHEPTAKAAASFGGVVEGHSDEGVIFVVGV